MSNVFWYSTEKQFYLLNPFDIFTEMHLRTSAAAVCCQDHGQWFPESRNQPRISILQPPVGWISIVDGSVLIFPVDLSHLILPSPELDKVDGLVAAAAAAPVLCKVTMLNIPGVCPGPAKRLLCPVSP